MEKQRFLRSFHFQNLHGFRQDELTVHTFLADKADQTVGSIQLLQLGNAAGAAVTDVVVIFLQICTSIIISVAVK